MLSKQIEVVFYNGVQGSNIVRKYRTRFDAAFVAEENSTSIP